MLLTALSWGQPAGWSKAQPARLKSLGQEYQELRKQKGHFTGGGEWNNAVDRWDGRKHQVMGELGELLSTGESTERLLSVMGEPDARDGSHWVYYWRGRHDYLFFDCKDGKIVKSDWWMAGE